MSLNQDKDSNRYMFTVRLNYANENERLIIDALNGMEGGAHRGVFNDAMSAHIRRGMPLPREITNAEQVLLFKNAIRDTMKDLLGSGNFNFGDYSTGDYTEGSDDGFVQRNKFDDLLDGFGDDLLDNMNLT